MIDILAYDCTISNEDVVAINKAKYILLDDAKLKALFSNAKKAAMAGKPWKDTTIQAIVEVTDERGKLKDNEDYLNSNG